MLTTIIHVCDKFHKDRIIFWGSRLVTVDRWSDWWQYPFSEISLWGKTGVHDACSSSSSASNQSFLQQARWPSGLRCWPLQYRPWFYDCRHGFELWLGNSLGKKNLYWMREVISQWMPSVTISVHPWLGTQPTWDQCSPTGLSKAGGVSSSMICENQKDPLLSIKKSRGLSLIWGFLHTFVPQNGLRITVMVTDWKHLEFA